MHGGLARAELNHCLFWGGDLFLSGVRVETPTAHVDLAPTILRALGLPPHPLMPGRALEEAFAVGDAAPAVEEVVHEAGRGRSAAHTSALQSPMRNSSPALPSKK